MERYVLLLRGVNVGGKNKVSMYELKKRISELGYANVTSYINSGNLIFNSGQSVREIKASLEQIFMENYPFSIPFALISRNDYRKDASFIPAWWNENMARKDVLFYTDEVDIEDTRRRIEAMKFGNEKVHFGEIAVYWGKYSMEDYSKTAYAKYVLAQPFYRQITIRNGNTHHKLLELLNKE